MKRVTNNFEIYFLIAIFYSCSPQDPSNPSPPVAPSNLTAELISGTQVDLFWTDNSTNESGFKIERKIPNGTWSVVGSVGENVTSFSNNGLTVNTSYIYRVYSFNSGGFSPIYSNEISITTRSVPLVRTNNIQNITNIGATLLGTVVDDYGFQIATRGFCYDTTPSPTIDSGAIEQAGTLGNFAISVNTFIPNTTYFIRAYATNANGIGYGPQLNFRTTAYSYSIGPSVTDIDGNIYPSINTNFGKTWTTKNLNVSRYKNGDLIPQVLTPNDWINVNSTGAWCYYNNDPANGAIYGKLYNGYTIDDLRGLAPNGWHIATFDDWRELINNLGGFSTAGGALKSTSGWQTPNVGATNSSGFNALPAGVRLPTDNLQTSFVGLGNSTNWWSFIDAPGSVNTYGVGLGSSFIYVYDDGNIFKKRGLSLRLVKD